MLSENIRQEESAATGHDDDVDNVLMVINISASFNSMEREAWQMQVLVLLRVLIIGEHS